LFSKTLIYWEPTFDKFDTANERILLLILLYYSVF